MKAVMLSIQPKWTELIASEKKTVEVRKTKPKIDVPFKCYIYCSDSGKDVFYQSVYSYDDLLYTPKHKDECKRKLTENGHFIYNGKVIGEFVCDGISEQRPYKWRQGGFEGLNWKYNSDFSEISCVTQDELMRYGNRKTLYGWHITDLVIYDEPKELSEFYIEGDCDCMNCKNCAWFDRGNGYNVEDDCNLAYKGTDEHKSYKPIKRPFQSWGYVEQLKGETE